MISFLQSLNIDLLNLNALLKMMLFFTMDLTFIYLIIDKVYYRINRDKRYYFTFLMMNILVFFVSSLLVGAKVKTGFAFGMFAIFSILRYRTDQINSKEMTFLFISVILGVLNSLVTDTVSIAEILFADVMIAAFAYFLELLWQQRHDDSIRIIYEKVELIRPDRRQELIDDLCKRTGVNVKSVVVNKINYLQDTADILVFYDNKPLCEPQSQSAVLEGPLQ
jgi:hypothetical protein